MKNAINFLIHAMKNETVACNVIPMRYRKKEKTTFRPLRDQYKTLTDKLKNLAALFALLFMIGIGSVWGGTVTFIAGTDTGETSVTKDGVTVSMSTMSRDDNYRCYASSDMTVTSSYTITKIELTCTASGTSNYGPGKFSGTGYSYSGYIGTWTGSATSVTLSASSQVRMTEIVVTYSGGTSYTVGWSINPAAGGTLSTTSGTSTTVTPAEGYTYGSPAYTVLTGAATVAQSTNTFTATPTANSTIQINMVARTSRSVTFKNNGTTVSSTTVYDGDAVGTLPTLTSSAACDPTSTTFMGWTESTISTKTSTEPTYISAETIVSGGDKVYNAVWAKASSGGSSGTVSANLSTLQSAVSGISSGYSSVSFDVTDGVDDYSCDVTASKSTNGKTSGWMQVGKIGDNRYIQITDALPGAVTNISSSNVYNASGSTWSGTAYYSNNASTTDPIASKAFSAVNSFSLDVEGGNTDGYIFFSSVICLGNITITYSSVTYTDYLTSCGPQLSISDAYVTSTSGQKVKIIVPITATNFTNDRLISYTGVTTNSSPFKFIGWTNGNSITAGNTLETGAILEYKPTAYGTNNNVGITFSAMDASKTVTIHGRSLPQQFAVVATSSTKDWAMPANTANTAASRTGREVTISGTPETVETLPSSFVYTLESVGSDDRYAANGIAVRLKGYNTNGYLKAVSTTSAEVANLTDAATTDYYEWILATTDNETYNISNSNFIAASSNRTLRYWDKYFGMYASGQQSIRFLPVGCSTMPEKVTMTPTHNSVTVTFEGTNVTHHLLLKQGSTTIYNSTITSGQVIDNLSPTTTYTYTLTPGSDTECAVEGEFTTTLAPITITLVRHNMDNETLTNVENPYTLPTAADACADWAFVGWTTSEQDNATSAPTLLTQATASGTYYAVYRANGGSGSSTVTDALDYADFAATGSSYVDFEDVSLHTAVYAGNSANYSNEAIQLRSKNDNSGIVTTTSGGVAKSVSVTWNSNTTSGKILSIYGKNSAYSDASELYNSSTYGTFLGNIVCGTSTSLTIDGTYTYIGVRSSDGAIYLNTLTFVWTTGAEHTYSTKGHTDCVVCSEAGAAFSLGNAVTKNTESANFTNTVTYTKTNNSSKTWTSSNTLVADVDEDTGEVTIKTTGETVISMTQPIDMGGAGDADNVCAVSISYTLTVTPPTVEVVEVTSDDKIIIEHDLDGASKVILEEATTKISGTVAEDIFISKYYEAASNMKLFGLYNGTNTYIDMSILRVRSGFINSSQGTGWPTKIGDMNYVELSNVSKLGEDFPSHMLPPFTEIIFWSNNYGSTTTTIANNTALRNCVSMTINDVTYDINDMEEGNVPNWYCLGDYKTFNTVDADGNNQFTFNGDDPLILERWNGSSWVAIDLFGAGTEEEPIATEGSGDGQVQQCSTSYTIHGKSQALNDGKGYYYSNGTEIPYTTNRAYLVRKKTVKSGKDAVRDNQTLFTTLGSEWNFTPVGGEDDYCYSGTTFSEVGQYDFANYYTTWEEVSESGIAFKDNEDGTATVTVPNLASHSCNTLRIEVADKDNNILAQTDYKVPIMVKSGTVETTNTIFTGFGEKAAEICSTCDVVIMNGATLKKVDGDVNALRDVEVYAGGTLLVPDQKSLTTNQLIMRSAEDVFPKADIQGTLTRYNTTILHDKRIDGNRWYFFTLPFDCDIADIAFRNGDPAVHGTDYLIQYYDGEERAREATSTFGNSEHWKEFKGSTLLAGQGYIMAVAPKTGHTYAELRFPMKDPNLKKTFTTVSVRAWGGDKTQEQLAANHKGWNLIGNPFLNTYNNGTETGLNYAASPLQLGTLEKNAGGKYEFNTTGDKNVRFVYVPVDGGRGNYTTVAVSSQTLDPFFSYFAQIGGNPNTEQAVDFTWANVAKASIVSRSRNEVDNNKPIMVALDLSNSKGEKDETTFLVSNQFTDDYDIMDDGLKWRGSNYTAYSTPLIASRNNAGEMAFNALPDASAAAGIPINYYTQKAGDHTFAINGAYSLEELKEVWLYDANDGQYYDLLTNNPTLYLAQGNNTERFTLFVRVERKEEPEIATGNDNILADGKLGLMAIDQTLVLSGLTNDADVYVYDISGKLMISDHVSGNSIWRTTVPAIGVYFVRVNGTNGQQTLRTIVK